MFYKFNIDIFIYYNNSCFKQAWKPHCECHANIELPPVSLKDGEPITPLPTSTTAVVADETAAGNHKQSSSNTNSNTSNNKQNTISNQNYTPIPEGWINISTSKEYIPTSSDVGCRLRIEVSAVAVADGEVLSGPIAIFTEPVLQAPSAPPKRVSLYGSIVCMIIVYICSVYYSIYI